MLRSVPHTVPRVGRSYEHFPDGFELHLLHFGVKVWGLGLRLGFGVSSLGFEFGVWRLGFRVWGLGFGV